VLIAKRRAGPRDFANKTCPYNRLHGLTLSNTLPGRHYLIMTGGSGPFRRTAAWMDSFSGLMANSNGLSGLQGGPPAVVLLLPATWRSLALLKNTFGGGSKGAREFYDLNVYFIRLGFSRPSTRCRTSCCWSRNTGVSDHVRVYTRCASSVWTLLFGVFVAVFASLSSAVRCCLLILGCCRAFSCGSLQIVVPWLLPSAWHRFFGRCCSFGLFPWLLPCAFSGSLADNLLFRVSSSCRWQLLAVLGCCRPFVPVLWQIFGCSLGCSRPLFCAGFGRCWLFLWRVTLCLSRPAVVRYLAVFLLLACPLLADCGCSLAVAVRFSRWLFLADCWVLWLLLLAALT